MKQIVASVVIILVAASLGAVGAVAHFVDTERSQDNTYQAGMLNLVLSDGDPVPMSDGVRNTWNIFLAFPHDSVSRSVHLINFGNLGEYIDVGVVCENGWRVPPSPPRPLRPKDEVLIVTQMVYARGTPAEQVVVWVSDPRWPDFGTYDYDSAVVTDYNGDGLISLDDLGKQTITFTPAPQSDSIEFRMGIQFEPQFGPYPINDYQDIETDATVLFTLW